MKKKIKVWWHDFCTDPCYYIVIFLGLLLLSIICTGGISSILTLDVLEKLIQYIKLEI